MVHQNKSLDVELFICHSHFPKRLRLVLYTTGISSRPDCVNRMMHGQLRCVPQFIYPFNRLRNMAIENTVTSHFVVFDMDMWPASYFMLLIYCVEMVYSSLMNLPQSYFENPYNAMIIPSIFLSQTMRYHLNCTDLKTCVEKFIIHST